MHSIVFEEQSFLYRVEEERTYRIGLVLVVTSSWKNFERTKRSRMWEKWDQWLGKIYCSSCRPSSSVLVGYELTNYACMNWTYSIFISCKYSNDHVINS